MQDLLLSPEEARVVAALVEKSITTPKYYPMTTNALMAACNQKNCRYPLMQMSEGEVGAALRDLRDRELVAQDDGGRALRWRHRLTHGLRLSRETQAVLVTLMLRGPQTLLELRAHAEALGGPADAEGVRAALDDLTDRAQPMVRLLERAPGQKEARYAHLLCGEDAIPEVAVAPAASSGGSASGRLEALEARVAVLEDQLRELLERATG